MNYKKNIQDDERVEESNLHNNKIRCALCIRLDVLLSYTCIHLNKIFY
jgi:hypothetical protein